MIIDIILPFKEKFTDNKASAVSLTIKNALEFSKFKTSINVFGQSVNSSFKNINFIGFKTNKIIHFGNNRSIILNYLDYIKNDKDNLKKIIELHNRPYLFNLIYKKLTKYPITLHFHNDPRTMRGSMTITQREKIAKNATKVYFVSNYIKECFKDGLNENYKNLHVIPNGIERTILKQPKKNKEVIFIGRLVPEKGVHLFVNAIKNIIANYPQWTFRIIGASKAGEIKLKTRYEKKTINDFLKLGSNVFYSGFIKNKLVKKYIEKSSIVVVPSIWEEPFALTALEGMCGGAAIIGSEVGGLKEMLLGTGKLIKNIDEIKLSVAINGFLENDKLLKEYQNKSWYNYRYNQSVIVKDQDMFRNEIFDSFY